MRTFLNRWNVTCNLVKKEVIPCRWKYPAEDEVMVNIDGSKTDSSSGYGAIIRDTGGFPVAAACGGSVPRTVLLHEMQGADLGLQLALRCKCLKIHLSTDSMALFHLFKSKNPKPPWTLIYLWRKISFLRRQFRRVRCSHVYRETNRAADWLAAKHPNEAFVELDLSELGEELSTIILEDRSLKTYFRT